MNQDDFDAYDILRLRYHNGFTIEEIAEQLGFKTYRVKSLLKTAQEKIFAQSQREKILNNLGMKDIPEEMQDFIFLVGKEYKDKLLRIISYLEIEKPSDFLKHGKQVMMLKGVGDSCFLAIKKALLKLGIPYDGDDEETINIKLESARMNSSGSESLRLRFKILARDNFTCQYCGRSVKEHGIVLQVDHIFPASKGGRTKEGNLVAACRECNIGKGDVILNGR